MPDTVGTCAHVADRQAVVTHVAQLVDGVVEGGGRKLEEVAFGAPAREDRGLINLKVPVWLRGDGATKAEEAKVKGVFDRVGEPEGLGVDVVGRGKMVVFVIVGRDGGSVGVVEVDWIMDEGVRVAGYGEGRTGEERFVGMGRHWA